jgi:hypothetical protein
VRGREVEEDGRHAGSTLRESARMTRGSKPTERGDERMGMLEDE